MTKNIQSPRPKRLPHRPGLDRGVSSLDRPSFVRLSSSRVCCASVSLKKSIGLHVNICPLAKGGMWIRPESRQPERRMPCASKVSSDRIRVGHESEAPPWHPGRSEYSTVPNKDSARYRPAHPDSTNQLPSCQKDIAWCLLRVTPNSLFTQPNSLRLPSVPARLSSRPPLWEVLTLYLPRWPFVLQHACKQRSLWLFIGP